jgi:hypothetical protein
MFIEKSIPLILSSDPANGAHTINRDGNEFSVTLDNPISIPSSAVEATIEVNSANIVWVVPNISEELKNNHFVFEHKLPEQDAVVYDIVIQDGLYSMKQLAAYLSRALINLELQSNLITIAADDATQSTIITFNNIGISIDFTAANSVNTILGFSAKRHPITGSLPIGGSLTGEEPAVFNYVSRFTITTDLVGDGIPTNQFGRQVIASIPITVEPGSTLHYTPYNPTRVNCRGLIGAPRNNFRVRLLDQDGRQVDTRHEFWDFLMVIRYKLLIHPGQERLNKHERVM